MLKNCLYILVLWLLFGLNTQAQVIISGVIKSPGGEPISNATITLKDSIHRINIAFAISKADGMFLLKKQIQFRGNCDLIIEHISSQRKTLELKIHSGDQQIEIGEVILDTVIRELKNIVITSHTVPFSIRGDTVEFKAKSFKTAETRKVEDLLRNMQGFDLGSDGRISFNGKEVDRILIEGEDLTEKNYQLLSRNLNANLVDKVQVINNFSTDRLLKEVENSGKVGINLTIDEKYKNKLSGGVEAGYAIGKKAFLDNNLVYLTRKIKLLSFLNYNETGLPANINLQYYFNQGESTVTSGNAEQSVNGILQTGTIYLPSIGQSYVRDNEDISSFMIGSWKSGQHLRMKILAGRGRSRLKKNADGFNEFFPSDGNSWELFQKESFRSSNNESIIKFSLAHDRKKNNTGYYSVDLLGNQNTDSYDNLTGGAITDSLHEFLPAKGRDYKIIGKETWKIGKGKILKAGLQLKHGDMFQNFHAMTNRYQDFFMLDSSFIFYKQRLKGLITNREFDIAILGRKNLLNWSTGAKLTMERTSYDANAMSSDIGSQQSVIIFQAPSQFHSFKAMVFGMVNRPIHKKGLLSSGLNLGVGSVKINQENSLAQKTAPVFKGMIGYKFALSPIKNLSVQFNISQLLPERIYFHPSLLLAGQATILNPAEQLVSRSTQSLNFSYASHSLHKGSVFVFYASYSHTNGAYSYSTSRTPAYGLLYYQSQNGNQMWNVNIKLEQYVKQIRAKFSIELSTLYITSNLLYNEIKSLNKMGNLSFLPKAVTAFKGPVNLETSFTAMYTRNITIPETGTTNKGEVWQYQGYGKLKIQSGKKLYMATMYNYYLLAPKNFFQTMDAYANFTMNQAWMFSFTFHNLFNNTSIVQRQLSVNSVSEQRFGIVGRYLMVKAQWSF